MAAGDVRELLLCGFRYACSLAHNTTRTEDLLRNPRITTINRTVKK